MADMDYQEDLAGLDKLDAAGLTALSKKIVDAFETAESDDDLDAMSAAADALDQVKAAQSAQATVEVDKATDTPNATDTAAEAQPVPVAASADPEPEVTPEPESEPTPDPEPTPEPDPEPEPEPEPEADPVADPPPADADPAVDPDPTDKEGEDAVTASSDQKETAVTAEVIEPQIPEDRRPLVASSVTTILAGADIPQRAAGSEFGSYDEVSEAFVARINTLRNSRGGDGDHVIIASVQSTVDSDRELIPGQEKENGEKIDTIIRQMQRVDRDALVASGGYCAPLETRYDIFGVGVADRPVRDSLAGFQATRGGIRYVAPPVLSSFSSAVGLWTAANDANPSSPTTKPFMTVACQSEVTVTADAVTLEMQFGNLMTRAFPELVARNNELGLIYHARFAEENLLTKIAALSTAVTAGFSLGTARDFLLSLGKACAAYRSRHRMPVDVALRAIVPAWVREAIREDLMQGYPGNNLEWADAEIDRMLDARNCNIAWHLDDTSFLAAQSAGALIDFPSTIVYYLFAEGTFLFLDGGTLDLGIVRDSTLVGTNDYRMFSETFENVAKVGVESLKITVTTHATGLVSGAINPINTI